MRMNNQQFDKFTRTLGRELSRRDALKLIGTGLATAFLSLVGCYPQEPPETPTPPGEIACPDCGTCIMYDLDFDSEIANDYDCPKQNICLATEFCAQANRTAAHQELMIYLADQGFIQSGQPQAYILRYINTPSPSQRVSLIRTHFIHSSDSTQTAYLVYVVRDNGETGAYAVSFTADEANYGLYINEIGEIQVVYSSDLINQLTTKASPTVHLQKTEKSTDSSTQNPVRGSKVSQLALTYSDSICNGYLSVCHAASWNIGVDCSLKGAVVCAFTGFLILPCALITTLACAISSTLLYDACPWLVCSPFHTKCCGLTCVDPDNDQYNCGDCSIRCLPGSICCGGSCKSPDGFEPCGSECCDNRTQRCCDGTTCCDYDQACCDGTCLPRGYACCHGSSCPERGQTCCGFDCIYLDYNEECCDGVPVDTLNDPENCGGCGISCTNEEICSHCVDGACVSGCATNTYCCESGNHAIHKCCKPSECYNTLTYALCCPYGKGCANREDIVCCNENETCCPADPDNPVPGQSECRPLLSDMACGGCINCLSQDPPGFCCEYGGGFYECCPSDWTCYPDRGCG